MTSMSKADVILHPVRMRIIQSLIKRPLTSQELMEWLPDIPQATLYRQLKVLSENEMIYVSKERKIKGTFERTYAIDQQHATISPNDALEISKDEHLKYFITYTMGLLQGVENYLQQDTVDMEKDGFGYSQVDLYLDDEELKNFSMDYAAVFNKYGRNEPNEKRRRRTLATVIIPE
ncbi:helix-turn-helix domain-containing protein [Salipaludibacillus daqingensis]|uniref:helix-turn-helix domain-containing protein n=1 Tax=Salipaludibacillus daqingensis TaxID=3041001 RepID=UPI002473F170|nr:helix-turn-helix domain-containing protein [Salipaludibacillus daqingensis]